jgi:hypothetical protein
MSYCTVIVRAGFQIGATVSCQLFQGPSAVANVITSLAFSNTGTTSAATMLVRRSSDRIALPNVFSRSSLPYWDITLLSQCTRQVTEGLMLMYVEQVMHKALNWQAEETARQA